MIPKSVPSEFGPLAATLQTVRRRIAGACFLDALNRTATWTLAALLVVAVVLPLEAVMVSAVLLAATALVMSAVSSWRSRPSVYESACRVDAAAGLQDRLSTAWHFATERAPDALIRRQRHDALGRLVEANPASLFPMPMPAGLWRTALLAVATTGLLLYRTTHPPPLMAAVERATPTAVARAIQDLRRTITNQYMPEPSVRTEAPIQVEAGDLSEDGSFLPTFKKEGKGSQSSSPGRMGSPIGDGDPDAAEGTADEDPSGAPEQPQTASGTGQGGQAPQKTGEGPASEGEQVQEGQPGSEGDNAPPSRSLSERLRQALSDLLAKARGDQPKNAGNRNQSGGGNQTPPAGTKKIPAPPGSQPSGPPAPSEDQGEAKEEKDAGPGATMASNQAGSGDSAGGDGNQPRALELAQETAMETQPKQDVVPLGLTNFRGEASMLTTSQRGTAQTPLRDAAPTSASSTRGSEQGEVPLRYRAYVQEYFTHPEEARR